MSAHPFWDLPLGKEQHRKLLPGIADIQAGEVARWTADEVVSGLPWGPGGTVAAEAPESDLRSTLKEEGRHGFEEIKKTRLPLPASPLHHLLPPCRGPWANLGRGDKLWPHLTDLLPGRKHSLCKQLRFASWQPLS